MHYRAGEVEQVRFRANRIFNVEGKYYFNTREGTICGPFQSEASASKGVLFYIQNTKDKQQSNPDKVKRDPATAGIWEQMSYR